MARGEVFWWGTKMCCDEEETKQMCNVLDAGGTLASLAGSLTPGGGEEKIAITIAGAAVKIGTVVIKAVDVAGGSNGVCMYSVWGPGMCWVKARPV